MIRCNSERKGFFVVRGSYRRSMTEMEALFQGFIPVQIEYSVLNDETRFYGYSEHFREIDQGHVVPEYIPTIKRLDDGSVAVSWRCELDPEPTPGISEPDYDRIRRAVEIVIKRHEIEWRKQSEAFEARYRIEYGDAKDALHRLFATATEVRCHIAHPGLGFVSFPGDNQLMRAGSMAGSLGGLLGSNV